MSEGQRLLCMAAASLAFGFANSILVRRRGLEVPAGWIAAAACAFGLIAGAMIEGGSVGEEVGAMAFGYRLVPKVVLGCGVPALLGCGLARIASRARQG